MVRGNRWEYGYCGDFGAISSLQPSEKAKLVHVVAPSVHLSITVTDSSNKEDYPRSFSRAELEDMVRRWDFLKMNGPAGICSLRPFQKQ